MKETKSTVTAEKITSNPAVAPTKKFSFPATFTIKKGMLMKIGIALIVIILLVPVLDFIIQTSITSRYVAFYKGTPVTRTAYVAEMERQYGDQVVNEMLAKAAIAQAAKERGITVSDAEVKAAIDADKARAGITTDADFQSALAQNNITVADYTAYVKVTATLDKLISGTVAAPTDKEISDYFAQNATQFPGKKLADVKAQIVDTLTQTALNTKRQDWITSALSGYNANNELVSASSKNYKFLRSIDLIKRLFSNDPTK